MLTGCGQGPPGSPVLWNPLFGEMGSYVPTLAIDNQGQLRRWGDGAGWFDHLSWADYLLPLAKSEAEIKNVYVRCFASRRQSLGLAVEGHPDRWQARLAPASNMTLLGALLSREGLRQFSTRPRLRGPSSRPSHSQLMRALTLKLRLSRLRSGVLVRMTQVLMHVSRQHNEALL